MIENDEYLESILRDAFTNTFERGSSTTDFYPSSCSAQDHLGNELGECTRKLFYDKKGVMGAGPDIKGSFIMANGGVMGDFLSRCFQKAGVAVQPNGMEGELRIRIERETEAGNKYALSGRVDQLCLDPRGQVIGYEFKTVYSKGKANRVLGDWRGNYNADPKNIMQTAIYAWWGRSHGVLDWRLTYFYIQAGGGKRPLPLSRTYYVNVTSEGVIYVDGEKQPYTVHSIFEKFDLLADSLEKDEPPEREYKLLLTDEEVDQLAINGKLTKKEETLIKKGKRVPARMTPCTYCAFQTECWTQEELEEFAESKKIR